MSIVCAVLTNNHLNLYRSMYKFHQNFYRDRNIQQVRYVSNRYRLKFIVMHSAEYWDPQSVRYLFIYLFLDDVHVRTRSNALHFSIVNKQYLNTIMLHAIRICRVEYEIKSDAWENRIGHTECVGMGRIKIDSTYQLREIYNFSRYALYKYT